MGSGFVCFGFVGAYGLEVTLFNKKGSKQKSAFKEADILCNLRVFRVWAFRVQGLFSLGVEG